MILLALYAVLVWIFVAKWRRTWRAYALAMGAGVVALLLMPSIYAILSVDTRGPKSIDAKIFMAVMWLEGFIVMAVGVFIASLPRRDDRQRCPYCRYDLAGHKHEENPVCPECGTPRDGYASNRRGRPSESDMKEALRLRRIAAENEFTDPEAASLATRLAAQHAAKRAKQQDAHGHAGDQRPADDQQRSA